MNLHRYREVFDSRHDVVRASKLLRQSHDPLNHLSTCPGGHPWTQPTSPSGSHQFRLSIPEPPTAVTIPATHSLHQTPLSVRSDIRLQTKAKVPSMIYQGSMMRRPGEAGIQRQPVLGGTGPFCQFGPVNKALDNKSYLAPLQSGLSAPQERAWIKV